MTDLDRLAEMVEALNPLWSDFGDLPDDDDEGNAARVVAVAPELIAVANAARHGEHFGTSEGWCTCGTPVGECPNRIAIAALDTKLAEVIGD